MFICISNKRVIYPVIPVSIHLLPYNQEGRRCSRSGIKSSSNKQLFLFERYTTMLGYRKITNNFDNNDILFLFSSNIDFDIFLAHILMKFIWKGFYQNLSRCGVSYWSGKNFFRPDNAAQYAPNKNNSNLYNLMRRRWLVSKKILCVTFSIVLKCHDGIFWLCDSKTKISTLRDYLFTYSPSIVLNYKYKSSPGPPNDEDLVCQLKFLFIARRNNYENYRSVSRSQV